jgi:hypothetical protein
MFCARDWVFTHIPKTGGTNLYNCAAYHHEVFKDNVDEDLVIENILQKHNTVYYWKARGRDWYLDRQFFTMVRNPYTRIASMWSHMQWRREFSFEEFIKDKKSISDYFPNHNQDLDWDIFLPQVKYIDDTVDVYKIETDLAKLEQYLQFPFKNHRSYVGKYTDYRFLYTDQLQDLVYQYFKEDFERFQYSKELI